MDLKQMRMTPKEFMVAGSMYAASKGVDVDRLRQKQQALPEVPAEWLQLVRYRGLPIGWELQTETCDGQAWRNIRRGLVVLASIAKELDGHWWLHVSASRRARIPTYDDVALVKRLFVGTYRKAVQVFVAESEHVNVDPTVLHLWSCLDHDPLPDFTQGTGVI